MEFVVNKSLGRFYTELATREVVGTEEEIAPKIPKEGDVILIGITSDDVDAIAKHLEENHDLRVYIMFTEFALRYQMFVKAFTNRSCASRLLFATNLPHWADEQTASETVRKFHSATNDKSKRTPLALMGFCVGRLIQEAVGSQQKVDGKALSDLFLGEVVLHADDMRYGPFVRGKCADIDFGDGGKCITNYGATEISVWSMERVLDPSVPLVEEPISEPLQYVDPGVWVLTSSMIGGMGATFCFLASIAATVMSLTRYFWGDARDNQYAPKVPTAPVTLIFTDIESSTALWAAHPELMPDVVATHHQLIRSLIVRYGCYEVKTVGDSFMIACRSPLAAVQLAGDLQRCFLHHDWGTTAFDDAYRDFEQQRAEEDVEYAPPTAHLDPEVYSQLWNGLRVRVGIHTGLCDIRRDEVTKGYDYYGRTSNMAARTESVANGGQVLLTRAAYLALSTVEREQVTVTSLGPVALRGEPEPVEMHQLDAVPGRTFAALRLDREIDENGLSEMNSPNGSTYNVPNELTHAGRQIRDSMKALLFVLTPPQSQRFLSILCGWWHVPYPRQDGSAWEKSHRADVIRQIAAKVSRIEECALRRRASTFKVFPARSGRSPSTICGIELAQSDTDSHISFGQNGGEEIKDADRISPRDTAASPASISMSSITYVVPFYKPGSPT
ncbi:unnamed protein product [Trypanosoma congolense IL3000]|uniref:adenylate cyclase n=1 Tax=Trypanosoma congolense (strain IL3000) TaxID=1068625 RepID=F9WBD5_TRYCI|nr:unnamed protein product [Trypanosoma congolense IL3000]